MFPLSTLPIGYSRFQLRYSALVTWQCIHRGHFTEMLSRRPGGGGYRLVTAGLRLIIPRSLPGLKIAISSPTRRIFSVLYWVFFSFCDHYYSKFSSVQFSSVCLARRGYCVGLFSPFFFVTFKVPFRSVQFSLNGGGCHGIGMVGQNSTIRLCERGVRERRCDQEDRH